MGLFVHFSSETRSDSVCHFLAFTGRKGIAFGTDGVQKCGHFAVMRVRCVRCAVFDVLCGGSMESWRCLTVWRRYYVKILAYLGESKRLCPRGGGTWVCAG